MQKNQFTLSAHFWDIVNFKVPHPFLGMLTPKYFYHILICMDLYQHAKQLIPSVHSWDKINFRVPRPSWPHLFLTVPNQKILNQLLIFVNLYQHAKKWDYFIICSGEIVDLKILQSDLLRAFWPISLEQDFSQYRICAGKQQKI